MSINKELDTIAAIATPTGKGALAIVRISGPLTESIIREVFRKGKSLAKFEERKVYYGFIVDPTNDEVIDEVTLIFYRAPKSFTGEDMAEIISHGGLIVPNRILGLLIKLGARVAERGEFAKRAFLNGKIDLIEAEAIANIIEARNEIVYRCALENLKGNLSGKFKELKETLLDVTSDIEATIDFEEDAQEVDVKSIEEKLHKIYKTIEEMLKDYEKSRIIETGLKVVIIGKPNVGKSSLLNALLEKERAIVTDIPGTTRDTIEETTEIDGVFFRIIDTAGIRKTTDPVEKIGVEKSLEKLEEGNIIIAMFDISEELGEDDKFILRLIDKKKENVIVVLNKLDKGEKIKEDMFEEFNSVIKLSVKEKIGLESLKKKIKEFSLKNENIKYYINERHYNCLIRAKSFIERGIERIKNKELLDIISVEVKEAIRSIEEIIGEITTEDILNSIFSKFCIGK